MARPGARGAALIGIWLLGLAAPRPADALSLPPVHADPDPEGGGRIVDARGREVLLRGVNVNALAEYWRGGPFRPVFALRRGDPRLMAGIGWNAVRLLVSWSRIEPLPGRYSGRYLDRVAATIRRLRRHGIYTIVDLHQDAWGPSLAAPPATACAPPSLPALGWDGAPAWATIDGGAPRCYTGFREASPAVRNAWRAFLANAGGAGGVGIQDRYLDMLRHLAARLATTRALAGFDVVNEPNALGPGEEASLADFYSRALAAIRAGERAGGGRPHLVLFEPSVLWSTLGRGAPPDFARDRDVVYAPHIYAGGLGDGPVRGEDFHQARAEAAAFGGAPVIAGEWGADPERARDPGDRYFAAHQALQDELGFGAMLWTWRESCGDPHKLLDLQRGSEPVPWGVFEIDCADNVPTGLRAALVHRLRRGYVRAAPGELERARWDDADAVLSAAGRLAPRRSSARSARRPGARRRSRLVAFYPRRAGVSVRLIGGPAGAVELRRTPGRGVLVSASVGPGRWSLRVGPRRRR